MLAGLGIRQKPSRWPDEWRACGAKSRKIKASRRFSLGRPIWRPTNPAKPG